MIFLSWSFKSKSLSWSSIKPVFTLFGGFLFAAVPALCQQDGLLQVTEKVKPNVVVINSIFPENEVEYGLGFITGEREGKLYLVTAGHVINKGSKNNTVLAEKIIVKVFDNFTEFNAKELKWFEDDDDEVNGQTTALNIDRIRVLIGVPNSPYFSALAYGEEERPYPLDSLEYNLVRVEGGTFTMGCSGKESNLCDDDEKPQHQVTVLDFYISRYEVTQKEWRAVMESDPPNTISKGCDNCPAANAYSGVFDPLIPEV